MPELQVLTAEDLRRYQKDGYLVLPLQRHQLTPNVFTVQKWLEEIFTWPSEPPKWLLYEETGLHGQRQLLGTERIIDHHAGMKGILCADDVFKLLHQLTGKQVLLFKDEISWKLPGGNGAVPHVDLPAYGHMAPEFVEVMIAVDPHTLENGCLEFVAGSHRDAVPFSSNGSIDAGWATAHTFTPIYLNPGDAVIFGEKMAHCLGPNRTKEPRRAVFGTYHFDLDQPDLREKFFAHRLAHTPPINA